jgi:Uma2 family endonuclease
MMFDGQTAALTAGDYESLSESWEERERYELIAGELIKAPNVTITHQSILTYLLAELGSIVRSNRLGKVYFLPTWLYATEHDVCQPDLLFISEKHRSIIRTNGIHGAPDFVVEILSPSNAYYDLKTKKDIYQQIGVREYWIVDPMDHSIECFISSDAGFKSILSAKAAGKVCSQVVPEFCIELEEMFSQS